MNGKRWIQAYRATRPAARFAAAVRSLAGRWRDDKQGATAVQFIVVLPVFVLVIMGLYSVFVVLSARETMCEAAYEAARYLQIEAPHFPADDPEYTDYPDDWQRIAIEIVNQELASRTHTNLYPVGPGEVELFPLQKPRSPEDTLQVSAAEVDNNRFTVKVRKAISNPMGVMLGSDEGLGVINLSCTASGFYEGPPVAPTRPGQDRGGRGCDEGALPDCPPNPGFTDTPEPGAGTPTVCPICEP